MESPITVDTETLKALIKESIREVLKEEQIDVRQNAVKGESATDQNKIEKDREKSLVECDATEVSTESAKPKLRRRGSAKGKIWMAPDFDEPLEDFKAYME